MERPFGRVSSALAAAVLLVTLVVPVGSAAANPDFDLVQTFLPTDSPAGDRFGNSVAALGDNVLVGAPRDDAPGGSIDGAVYLLDGSTGAVLQTFLNPEPTAFGDHFGLSVAALGGNVLVGAPYGDSGGPASVYLFDASNGSVIHTFANPQGSAANWFGYNVEAVGDNVLVSAHRDTNAFGTYAGAVYLFDGSGALLNTFLPPSSLDSRFGIDIASLGDDIIVGAHRTTVGGVVDAGAVYLFSGSPPYELLETFHHPDPETSDLFGYAVTAVGNDVLVGVHNDDTGAPDTGAAYLFDASTGTVKQRFFNPYPDTLDWFGITLAAVGDDVLIGAGSDDDGGVENAGVAYLFDASTGQLLDRIFNPTPEPSDRFGGPVAAIGSDVLIAAAGDNTAGTDAGAVYRFTPGDEPQPCAQTLAQTLTINNSSDPAPSPLFGSGTSAGPYGVAVDDYGDIYAADPTANRAYRFDSTGTQTLAIAGPGFTDPDGIAVDEDGNFYVGNPGSAPTASVQKFSPSGARLSGIVGTDPQPEDPKFFNPRGIAVDDAVGMLYFAESGGGAARIYVADQDLTTVDLLIDKADPDPDFNGVGGVAVDDAGNIYVAGNYEVGPSSYQGIVYKFNSLGVQQWTLQDPVLSVGTWGVAVDGAGNIYVSDDGTGGGTGADSTAAVHGFRPSGERFLTIDNSSVPDPDPAFSDPHYLAVDDAGRTLYVSDRWSNTLYRFDIQCNQAPTVTADAGAVDTDEGQPAGNTGTVSDPDGDDVTLSASVGAVVNNGDGTWSWSLPTFDGPGESQTVTISADDGNGGTAQATFELTVDNVAPTVDNIMSPPEPVAMDSQPVSVSAMFSDPAGTNDELYTCSVDYGDGPQPGTVAGTECDGPDHTYAEPGVYTVSVAVTDKDGGVGSAVAADYIVIYDPSGAFVTGGGWIDSPAGAYEPDPSLAGRATFGFVSKYKKGATVPTGNTEFQFNAGDLNFHSDSYDWLVVTGNNNARFKGVGTINGEGEYKFHIWAEDDNLDKFRIKIWTEDVTGAETLTYDNGFNQSLGGGSIVIHTKK